MMTAYAPCLNRLHPEYPSRHAKKELKKHVRGIRKIERSVSNSDEKVSEVVQAYCLAVRGSLTSDGRPPLDASGLKLQERLTLIEGFNNFCNCCFCSKLKKPLAGIINNLYIR